MTRCVCHSGSKSRRRGATIVEAVVSLVVLSTVTMIVVQSMAGMFGQQRMLRQQALAREEAANLMERAFALPWDQLTNDELAGWEISEPSLRSHAQAKLAMEVVPLEQSPASKRIRIEISVPQPNRQASVEVQLVAWRYELRGAK